MAGLTENGYEAKRFRDLVEDVQQSLQDAGSNIIISDTSNKVVNNIVNPILLAIAEAYELGEEVWNSFDIDSATGIALDRLAQFFNTKRKTDEYSTGYVEFFQSGSGTVTENTLVQTTTGQNLYSLEDRALTKDLVRSFTIDYSTGSVIVGERYYITIGDDSFSYEASLGDTLTTVYSVLKSQIDAAGSYTTQAGVDTLTVKVNTIANLVFTTNTEAVVSAFSTLVLFRADEVGDIVVNSNTATKLLSSVANNVSVTNPTNFDRGSLQEDDESLRARLKGLSSVLGKATPDAILKAVSEVNGVDSVALSVNNTILPFSNGQPPKSYEAIVVGGADADIAQAILDTGGAGIRTYGNVSREVGGSQGGFYPISFTRPENVYIFLKVEYELYEEFNKFPVNGDSLIKNALVEYSKTLKPSQDLIPSSLNSVIYSAVNGIGEVRVTASYSNSQTDTSPVGEYSQDRVIINERELALITSNRIITTETNIQ